ncbi:monocarboxylate transporter 12-like [Ylistrum balloti]|uniref:monocarboxylate transporter 12-like n=1 Tax=Ylistrum balloti TaxID=509963 RepID=UPI002905BD6D|nr:monocarboxylate transporter 12-like [Ylistrum balloti]
MLIRKMKKLSKSGAVCVDPISYNVPDGGWGWAVTFSSFMVNVFIDGVIYTFGIFFPELLRYFGESKGKTQLLHSILVGTLFFVGPVASALVTKYGCRRVTESGSVIVSVGLFLSSFSQNLDVMILCYSIIGGIGFGLFYLPSIVIIGEYFDKRRSLATGLAVCGVGTFVFAPITEYFLETYMWRGTLWIMSAIILNGIIVSTTYRPLQTDVNRNTTKRSEVDSKPNQDDTTRNSSTCCQQICSSINATLDLSLLKSPTMLLYGASCFFVMFGYFVPSNFLPAWASEVNLSTAQGTFLISLMGVSNTITRVLVGYITDRPWANCLIIYSTALLIGGMSTCFVPFFITYEILVIYAIIFGAVKAVFFCLRSILMAELLGIHRLNSSFGLAGLCMGLSTYVGSPIAGALSDMSGNYNMAFYFGGISLGIGGLLCLPLRRISVWEKGRIDDLNKENTGQWR